MDAFDKRTLGRTTPHGPTRAESNGPGGVVLSRPGSELMDSALLQEITLLADVIASVSGIRSHLSREQVDAALGLSSAEPPMPPPCGGAVGRRAGAMHRHQASA